MTFGLPCMFEVSASKCSGIKHFDRKIVRRYTRSVELDVMAMRLEFEAVDPIHFPAGKAANILRGSLGLALPPEIFAPRGEDGPSGLADRPRPFVFRVRHLDGTTARAGEVFRVGVNLFAAEM